MIGLYLTYLGIKLILDYCALAGMGIWLSLRCRNPEHAVRWTVLWVLILPSLAIMVPDIIVDVGLIWLAGNRLNRIRRGGAIL